MKIDNLNPEFVKDIKEKRFKGRVIENEVYSRKLNFGQEVKSLVISDMHGYTNRAGRTDRLINEIRTQKPDVIFIPGDIFSGGKPWDNDEDLSKVDSFIKKITKKAPGERKLDKFKEFVKEISKTAPVVITWGNHDLRGMTKENEEIRLKNFHSLANENPGRIFPLYNEKANVAGIEVVGIVPEFNLMENEGMADQLNGRARDKAVENVNRDYSDLLEERPDTLVVGLMHDPHLLEVSANGSHLGILSIIDAFVAGHLHDGYLALFHCFNELKKKLTGTGFKVFDKDGGLVEQVFGLNDKNGNRVIKPRILGPTTGCRGNAYVDDYSNRRLLEVYGKWYKNVAPDGVEPDWIEMRRRDAIKEYLKNRYHCIHINEGLYPNFFLPIHLGTMDTLSVIKYKGAPENDDVEEEHTRSK